MIRIINRSMSIPIPDRVIGHVGDNLVETRSFELNRYYGEVDLSEFSFKLDTEIDGNKNIIDLDKTVEDDKITLTWTVHGSHVLHAGRMTIQIRAFHDGVEKWHSAQDYVIIQDSINAPDAYSSLLPSEFEQMELRVTTLKEQAEASAQTATEQANRAQDIADEFENETLPAAIAAVEAAVDEQVDIAASHADRAQGIADTFSDVTLPAAISAVEAAGQAKVDLAEQQAERVEDIIREAEQDVLPELRQAIEDGIEAKDQLRGSIQEAGEAKTALDGSISSAGTAKGELDGSITEANTAKGQLDGSITQAGTKKTELDGSITAAGQVKEALDESIATGDLVAFRYDFESHLNDYATYKDSNNLKVAKVEKELNDYKATMQQVNINQEPKQKATGYGVISLPPNAAEGQFSDVRIKGQTWTNLAGAGDTSPQTVENLNAAKTYLLINSEGANVTIDTVDTPTPVKLTGATSFDFGWESGEIALYELSTEEATLEASILGQKYHYVSGTKSTLCGVVKSVGKNIWGGRKAAEDIVRIINNPQVAYLTTVDGRNVLALVGHSALLDKLLFSKFKPNTRYVIKVEGRRADDTGTGGQLYIKYTDGIVTYLANHTSSWVKMRITTVQGKTVQGLYSLYGTRGKIYYFDYDTLQIEEGATETPYEPYKETVAYLPNVVLRSLPNGVKDEVRVSENKLIKRIGDKTNVASGTVINYADMADNGTYYAWNDDGETETGVKGDTLGIDATTLIYQLATPIEIPIQTSGSLVSYPSGTVYIEPFVADAGIYTDKMEVLYSDLPIKALEKISKVDFDTGLETELDITAAVIAEDKLSFTHPDLTSGDIVFFVYEYDKEGTTAEAEIEFYDSRFVVKDDVTEKFYKWAVAVADGVPSIVLVEV